ncbi:MAG: DNA mismatch repair endonuclease MutL [Planctomycetota bacterium]
MPRIEILSASLVNKIAAGEVIERPASVVKELMENALDAGASKVLLAVEKGGTERIRVTDNGHGIPADELPLAIASHATSKIADADDLFRIGTLGFRGEALASIAEVSRLSIRSRPADCESGAELEVVGGKAEPVRPVGCPPGTTIAVERLFFNTPVRHKFLRTTQTEMGHVTEAFNRLALAHPGVHFTLLHGERTMHDLPPTGDLRERVAALHGEALAEGLIPVEATDEEGVLSVAGYVANPSESRSHNRMQYLFLNGRHIRDRALQHALGESYRGLLLTGRYPICFLNLQMPPDAVDVNVHPAKLEVRFADSGRIYSHLLGTLRSRFLSTDLVARARVDDPADAGGPSESSADRWDDASEQRSKLFEWAKRAASPPTNEPGGASFTPGRFDNAPLELHDVPQPTADGEQQPLPTSVRRTDGPQQQMPASPAALQIHNRYLVLENEDGLEVIDQHALHERILYEELREKVLGGSVEMQRLLVPEPVDVSAEEAAAALANHEVLTKLGLEVESLGGETLLLSAYPAMLANLSPAEVLRGTVEKLLSGDGSAERRDLLDELLHMIACKAAVKYGDRLTPDEVQALLARRELAQDHHHCPHGRPTALVFTRDQLDRQFKRI